ncbi:MAG TPA: geranylgeranyl reductase family protein, partial [Limnochordia bacterium]
MSLVYDCAVVGTGPAGANALRHLARRGRRVIGIDKARFPRYKTCGGAISALAAAELDFEWRSVSEAVLRRVRLALRLGSEIVLDAPSPICHFVMRDRFDHLLVERAQEAGADILQGVSLRGIEIRSDHARLTTSAGEIAARCVIAADGANSAAAEALGLFERDRGIAIEAEVRAPQPILEAHRDTAYVSYADPPWGYGWCFPKAEHLSVGVGTLSGRHRGVKQAFERLLAQLGLTDAEMRVHGHPIPALRARRPRKLARPRALLAGDAAGLADPLSGEGIAHALASGRLAAQHVDEALRKGDFSFEGYQAEIQRTIGRELKIAAWIANRLYAFPRLLFWLFQRSPETVAMYFRIVSGEVRYAELGRHLEEQFRRFGMFQWAGGTSA